MSDATKLTTFAGADNPQPVKFIETVPIKPGVVCDVYQFLGDTTRDLGIVVVAAGSTTPRQRVLLGDKTIEGYISGQGRLTIGQLDGQMLAYDFAPELPNLPVEVQIGETMQWAAGQGGLAFYEICTPAYAEGRFENLTD